MQNLIVSESRVVTGSEHVTLNEVKTHLHITDSDNDTELTTLITQVRRSMDASVKFILLGKSF